MKIYKTKPFKHQKEAFEKSKNMKAFALLMDMGTGKTKVTIDTAAYLYLQNEINGMLIIVQKGLPENWLQNEVPMHLSDDIDYISHIWNGKKTKKELKILERFLNSNKFKILAVNIEALRKPGLAINICNSFLKDNNVLMIIDESTDIKTPTALQTKNIIKLSILAKFKRILTGSPVTKNPEDLFSQFLFLDPEIIGIKNFFGFKARYCIYEKQSKWEMNSKTMKMVQREFPVLIGFRRIAELKKKIRPYSFRVNLNECIDMPTKTHKLILLKMNKQQNELYEEMFKESCVNILNQSIDNLNQNHVIATIELVKILRLQQITSGFLGLDSGDEIPIAGKNPKIEAMLKICRECSSKVVIWARFQYEHKLIISSLKKEFGESSVVAKVGCIDPDLAVKAPFEFQNNSKVRFFVGNPQISKGFNLFAGNVNICMSHTFKYDDRLQLMARTYRNGQKLPVLFIDLAIKDSIDMKIIDSLKQKGIIAEDIVKDLQTFIRGK